MKQPKRYLYKITYLEPYATNLSEELCKFIPAYNVQDVITTVGYKHKVGNAYGVPILEVKIDKELKAGVDYLPEY